LLAVLLLLAHLRTDQQEPEDRDHADDRQESGPRRRGPRGGGGGKHVKHRGGGPSGVKSSFPKAGHGLVKRPLPSSGPRLAAMVSAGNQRGLRGGGARPI